MRTPSHAALLAAALGLCAAAATAQEATAPRAGLQIAVPLPGPDTAIAPPKLQVPAISLPMAVQLTILHDPNVLGATQQVALSSGQLRQASGRFDQFVSATPSYNRSLTELTNYFKDREQGKRDLLTRLGEEFTRASAAVQEQLAKNDVTPPQCPDGLDFVNVSENAAGDITDRTGLLFEDTVVLLPADLARGQKEYFQVCTAPTDLGARPESTLKVVQSINDAAQLGLGPQILTATQLPRETLNVMADITQEVAVKAKLAVTRLGANPIDEVNSTVALRAGYGKPFRNGLLLRADFRYQSAERNFLNKSLDAAFGGFGLRNEFPSFFTLSLDLPLGKNRGKVSTGAPERASEFSLMAERESLRETISQEVFSTLLAYLALQASQQSVVWLEESAARQKKLVDLSSQLVQGGEMAAIELNRVRARATLVDSQLTAARASLVQARVTLAQAMGVSVETLDNAPLAADQPMASPAPTEATGTLVDRAVSSRRELRAAAHLEEAAETLARAARADLKRRFDFTVTGGLNTLYESPLLRLFPAEQPNQPYTQGLRYTSLTGLWRSWERRWRPSISAQLVFELPTRNRAAHGRLVQEEASWERSRIQRREIERTVRDSVVQSAEAVRRAAETVARNREALGFYEKTMAAAIDRFEAGDLTMIDTLTTEEDLTRQRLAVVRAVQDYASLLARLKYETGELVSFVGGDGPGARVEFDASPFVIR